MSSSLHSPTTRVLRLPEGHPVSGSGMPSRLSLIPEPSRVWLLSVPGKSKRSECHILQSARTQPRNCCYKSSDITFNNDFFFFLFSVVVVVPFLTRLICLVSDLTRTPSSHWSRSCWTQGCRVSAGRPSNC